MYISHYTLGTLHFLFFLANNIIVVMLNNIAMFFFLATNTPKRKKYTLHLRREKLIRKPRQRKLDDLNILGGDIVF